MHLVPETTGRISVGDPLSDDTKVGSMISRAHADKVRGFVEMGLSDGGELLTRHLPGAPVGMPPLNRALYLIGYTAPVASEIEGLRLIGARIGVPDTATREEILGRLRERGDRDILGFLGG